MKNLNYISLFSSAGVGCFAFKKLGFNCIATVELLKKRLEIQKYNNICKDENSYIDGDLSSLIVQNQIINHTKKNLKKTQTLDLLIATPPCQGISVANHKKKNELKRNSLIVESIKITKTLKPKFFLYENVRSFFKAECTGIDNKNRTIGEEISLSLSDNYNYFHRVVNLVEYGSSSSRTRSVVLGVRKDVNIIPEDIFPEAKKVKTIRQLIGKFNSLKKMGEIDSKDIYHSFRTYEIRMLPWIKDLKPGDSAFQNKNKRNIPHRIIDGKVVYNQNKNSDKYKRLKWDQIPPCIHTRNDILASQNTIHPKENRVFSIRELMTFMSIPNDFMWSNKSLNELNKFSNIDKKYFLKQNELNIRHCIGEAVPTEFFYKIGEKILNQLNFSKVNTIKDISSIVEKNNLFDKKKLLAFIDNNFSKYNLDSILKIVEISNTNRYQNSAFFTDSFITRDIINFLTIKDREISILEPSVGSGNFLFKMLDKFKFFKSKIKIDIFDIDQSMLDCIMLILKKISIPKNIKINFFNHDFLLYKFNKKYDFVIGNPPFGMINEKNTLDNYLAKNIIKKNTNLFILFYQKSLKLSNNVNLIIPKSFLSSPVYNDFRNDVAERNVGAIFDFGEKGFKGVKIETIYLQVKNKILKGDNKTYIKSYINHEKNFVKQSYYADKKFPTWIIYRNKFFDQVCKKLRFNVFNYFRDRQITKKLTKSKGKYRVIKSRNISSNKIINVHGYDCYVDDIKDLQVRKLIDLKNTFIVPNLSYYPRAAKLPKNCIVDGSAAILIPKNDYKVKNSNLKYFATNEFTNFYKIARNYGTRSLNIDNNSIFYWGIQK